MAFIIFLDHIAYIGPGLGGGNITAIVGLFTSFVLSLIAIFWYPFKKLLRFIKSKFSK